MNKDLNNNLVSFEDFAKLLFNFKNTLILTTFLFLIFALIYIYITPEKYSSSVILKTNDSSTSSSMNSLVSQYGGLASMAGISLPDQGSNKADFAIEKIKSKSFLKLLLQDEEVRKKLYAVKSYDKNKKEVIYNKNLYNKENGGWNKDKFKLNGFPDYLQIHREIIEKDLSIFQDKKTQFIEITFLHSSPIFAKTFLELVVNKLNETSKITDLEKANHSLDYLQNQLLVINETDIRDSINGLIKVQLNKKMLANVEKDYILTTIDPSFIPDKPKLPNKPVILIICIMLGFITGSIIALIKNTKKL